VVATANFSAQQILEAGRRAEAEGNLDHAVRFYKHLTLHFAGTFEAADAVTALHRLDDAGPRYSFAAPERAASPIGVSGGITRAGRQGFATPLLGAPVAVAPEIHPAEQPNGETTARHRKRKHKMSVSDDDYVAAARLPAYRVGRFLAGLLTVLGGVGAVFGLGALVAGSLLPAARTANTFASAVLVSPAIAGGFTLAALVMVLVGQMARAVFALVLQERHRDAVRERQGIHEQHAGS
jgi:hypothetical protein